MGWYMAGTAPLASVTAPPPAPPFASPAAAEYVPTTSSARNEKHRPQPMMTVSQTFRATASRLPLAAVCVRMFLSLPYGDARDTQSSRPRPIEHRSVHQF